MRRRYFYWTYLVLALVLTIYGGYTLIYHLNHSNKLSVLSLVFLIFGSIMLLAFGVLCLLTIVKRKNAPKPSEAPKEEAEPEPEETPEPEPETEEEEEEPEPVDVEEPKAPKASPFRDDVTYVGGGYSVYDSDDEYVRKVGYGNVLRVSGNRILDMRNNTYYRIQGNAVFQDGGGQLFEINGNQIRSAFGGYLYELSGNSINKIFGGFYASISGNYITLYDSSEKYETTGSLNSKQLLVVAALLFGAY